MSSIALVISAHYPPPILGRCGVITAGTSSAITDLSADVAVKNHINTGAIITFLADGADVFIAFNNANTGTIDDTQGSTSATSCMKLPSNTPIPFQLMKGYQYLLTKAAASTKVRYWVSGINDSKDAGK